MSIRINLTDPFKASAKTAGKSSKSGKILKKNLEELFKERRSTLLILPAISRQVLLTAQSLPGCVLAGGAALELYTGDVNKIKDWDLFFSQPEGYRQARYEFVKRLGFQSKGRTDWSITLEKSGVIVQLITKHFPRTINQLFDNFDFSVCCFAVKGEDLYFTEQAAEDVELRQLSYICSDNIITTIKRIARYGQKGFKPTTECIKDLLADSDYIPEDGDAES
jgi:hypothetical protein